MTRNRIELECTCTLCKIKFTVWNIEESIGEFAGGGVIIGNWKCFNCDSVLIFDLVRGSQPYYPPKTDVCADCGMQGIKDCKHDFPEPCVKCDHRDDAHYSQDKGACSICDCNGLET